MSNKMKYSGGDYCYISRKLFILRLNILIVIVGGNSYWEDGFICLDKIFVTKRFFGMGGSERVIR